MRFGHLLGIHPDQGGNYFDSVLATAQASEAAGIDAVFYSDHFQIQRHTAWVRGAQLGRRALQRWRPAVALIRALEAGAARLARRYDTDPKRSLSVLECFTTLAAIAAVTRRVRLGALVAGVPYRNPALLAKINITLDVISHGRCIVGLGAGWHAEEFRAYGWPFPTRRERLDRLEEALQIVDALMTQRRTTHHGQHYALTEALSCPPPIQQPRPPILIGGSGRRLLRLVAQYGDYCNVMGDAPTVAGKLQVLAQHCAAVGRPYAAITRSNFVGILIARNKTELAAKRRRYRPWVGHPIIGTPEQVIAELQAFAAAGIQYVIFNLPDAHTLEPIRLLADTVLPALAGA